jgi:hypothetical protein
MNPMPKHPKRPRDPAQVAKLMIDIASGAVEDRQPTPSLPCSSILPPVLGAKGGKARAADGISAAFIGNGDFGTSPSFGFSVKQSA